MIRECHSCGHMIESVDVSEHKTESGMCDVCNNPESKFYNYVVYPCFVCEKWIPK